MKWQGIDCGEKALTPMRGIVKPHIGDVKTEASKKQIPFDVDRVATRTPTRTGPADGRMTIA